MKQVASALKRVIFALVLLVVGYVVLSNWSYVFAKTVKGEILEVERVTQANMVVGPGTLPTAQAYSFAVAIKDASGEIFTSSSEDRQWAIAKKGFCVEAKFYPYPPWSLDKAGTYFNARLQKLVECKPTAQNQTSPEPKSSSTGSPETPETPAPSN